MGYKYKHGEDIFEVVFNGTDLKIKGAKISIDADGQVWICQNDIDPTEGYEPEDKMGYKFAIALNREGQAQMRKAKKAYD
jgi:hypothetical protein